MIAIEDRLEVIENEGKELLVKKGELTTGNDIARDRYSRLESILASRDPTVTSEHKDKLRNESSTAASELRDIVRSMAEKMRPSNGSLASVKSWSIRH